MSIRNINSLREGTFVRMTDRHAVDRHLMVSRRLDADDSNGFSLLEQIETTIAYLIIHHPKWDVPEVTHADDVDAAEIDEPFPTPYLCYDMDSGRALVWWIAMNDSWNIDQSPLLRNPPQTSPMAPCRLN